VNLPLFLAQRFLARGQGAFSGFIIRLAAGATAVSVAVMIVAVAVVTGFQTSIQRQLFSFWGHVQISRPSADGSSLMAPDPTTVDPQLPARVRAAFPDVRQVEPYVLRPAIVRAGQGLEGLQLKGVGPTFRFGADLRFEGARIGHRSDTGYAQDILLSRTTAARLRLSVGDAVRVYFLEPGNPAPRIRKLRLAGTFHTGMDEVDRSFGLCDIRLLQRIAGWSREQVTGYQVDLADPDKSVAAADAIYRKALSAPLTTKALPEIYTGVFDWLRLQSMNVRVLLIIMALVAVINLCTALLILMMDRARAVGLLKALGQTSSSLHAVFVNLSLFVAGVGIVAGNVLGLGLCALQSATGLVKLPEETYYMRYAPVRVVPWHILAIDAATLLVCFVCLWLPALYLRRIRPVRVLTFR